MKKTAKSILLLFIITMLTLTLVGCGDNDKSEKKDKEEKSNKIVATMEESDSPFGDYTETVEVTLKDDKVDDVTIIMEFAEESDAESAEEILENAYETTRSGKKITVDLDTESFCGNDEVTKDEAKEYLEDDGYTIK